VLLVCGVSVVNSWRSARLSLVRRVNSGWIWIRVDFGFSLSVSLSLLSSTGQVCTVDLGLGIPNCRSL
jgi:hypothetical protein